MTANPWHVESLEAFSCLKCPQCMYTSKDEIYFQDHALKNHPLSHVFFGNKSDDQETNQDEHCTTVNEILKEEHNSFDYDESFESIEQDVAQYDQIDLNKKSNLRPKTTKVGF